MKSLFATTAAAVVLMATAAHAAPPTPTPGASVPAVAAAAASNVFLVMADDVGYAMSSAFGGPVPTPNMDRLAAMGQRYNRFNTTAICSPSRAALLTGRNHHHVGVGFLADQPGPGEGYGMHISPSAATIAQLMKLGGYSTAMFGKHHNVPPGEQTAAGPFDMWPSGLGFDYFYGFVGGDMNQWSPTLYRGNNLVAETDGPPKLLDHRLADDAIGWIHNQKAAAPDKPFFIYYAPASTHAPHHAPPEVVARFKGRFDAGWDRVREETWRRQLAEGIIQKGTKLTPRPDGIPGWDTLTPAQKTFAARTMEVAAATLAYQDAQLGRVIDEVGRMGLAANTLFIVVQGDNGASAELGPRGGLNEIGLLTNRIQEDDAWLTTNVDKLGGPDTYESYPAGWAWAMNTPFRWTKQYASMLGGVRNGMILSWPGHVAHPGAVCAEFSHLVDIAPTILEATHAPAPAVVNGVEQMPFDGRSLVPSLTSCTPDRPRTQYFEMTGKIGLYQDGWFLSRDNGRKPWEKAPPAGSDPEAAPWELYDLRRDFSQADNVAAKNTGRVEAMVSTWQAVATANHVFPLEQRFGAARGMVGAGPPRKRYDYWGGDVSLPATGAPSFAGRSFTLDADVEVATPGASGAVLALGSRFGGFSLYLDGGRPSFAYALSTRPQDVTRLAAAEPLPPGPAHLRLSLVSEGVGKGADVKLMRGDAVVATAHIPQTFLMAAGVGENLDVGRDSGSTVTDYRTPHGRFEGEVRHVGLTFD